MNVTYIDSNFLLTCLTNNGAFSYYAFGFPPKVNHIIVCVVNVLLSFSTTILNATTVLVYWRSSQLRKKMSYFLIMLLSLSDLGIGTFCNPTFVILLLKDLRRDNNCPLYAVFYIVQFALFDMSFTMLFLLNLERYLGIVHPIFHRRKLTKFKLLTALFILWCLVAIAGCVLFIDERVGKVMLSIYLCLFLIFLTYIYARIFLRAREVALNRISVDGAGTKSKNAFLRNIKLAKSCLIIVGSTFVCFCPMAITISFWKLSSVGRILWSWSSTFVLSSSTINSAIFFWRNQILRSEAKKVLRQTFSRTE